MFRNMFLTMLDDQVLHHFTGFLQTQLRESNVLTRFYSGVENVQGLVLLLWELVLLVAKEPEQKNQKNRGGFF